MNNKSAFSLTVAAVIAIVALTRPEDTPVWISWMNASMAGINLFAGLHYLKP